MTPWESDQLKAPVKSLNGDGGKGLAVVQETVGEHPPHAEADERMGTILRTLTEKARGNPKLRFTSLAHHLNEGFLKGCYEEIKRKKAAGGRPKAPGVDGVLIEEYGENLEANLKDLVSRMKAKAYWPQPVRRAYIPKLDGGKRPLGILTAEDKIVQLGLAKILSAIFEADFQEASYGFRPKRNARQAMARVDQAIMRHRVSYVVDMDIEKFFDSMSQNWLIQCLEVRITDPSLLRLVVRFLKSGVMEEGEWMETELGAPQGGNLSPVLSNIFLHYVLDLWIEKKIKPTLKGYADYCRFADDFIVCFEREDEAKAFSEELKARLTKFGLKISEKKSRVIAFGRSVWEKAKREGGHIGTFDFLGITHYCGKTQKGLFTLGRKTSSKKLRAKLTAMNLWLKSVRNAVPLKEWWPVLQAKLRGHYNYYGVSGNMRSLKAFHWMTQKWAFKWVNRRSQKRSYNWEQFLRYLQWNPLPQPRIYHPLYAYAS
jgi:RNA-directed DNA polymerase